METAVTSLWQNHFIAELLALTPTNAENVRKSQNSSGHLPTLKMLGKRTFLHEIWAKHCFSAAVIYTVIGFREC